MAQHYTPLIQWTCSRCRQGGEISLPPEKYHCDGLDLADKAHRTANYQCSDEWGTSYIRLISGEYLDWER